MQKIIISSFIVLLLLLPCKSFANPPTIRDLIGIGDGEGETILFTHFDKRFQFKLSDYYFPWMGIHLLDPNRLKNQIEHLNRQVAKVPESAYIDEYGHVVPHKSGIILDKKKFLSLMQENLYDETDLIETLPIQFLPPRVTTDTLKKSMEKLVSSFSTYYNSGNLNRSYNIGLATKAIHHYVILPGETFSFNKVVGKRTREKGYKRAPVIVRGELSEDIGGGICQVSSTLFNAVDRAGLTVVQRYSHSKKVGYVPPGRDATVSWYGPDFVFRNDFDFPIMVKGYSGHGVMTVQIYSSRQISTEQRQIPDAPKALPQESFEG